jgi:hypothetical protein
LCLKKRIRDNEEGEFQLRLVVKNKVIVYGIIAEQLIFHAEGGSNWSKKQTKMIERMLKFP